MKNLAFRKLSRTSSHRQALLRNLVTSLFKHEQIVTTVAKAKEAQREAEKVITLGKKGLPHHFAAARGYLYSPGESGNILKKLAKRFADRPGGYTRIQLYGNRRGDHAPRAILSLLDGRNDLRLEMTARAVGREAYLRGVRYGKLEARRGVEALALPDLVDDKRFREITRENVRKLTKFGGDRMRRLLAEKAERHALRLELIENLPKDENGIAISSHSYSVDDEKTKALLDIMPKDRGGFEHRAHIGFRPIAGQQKSSLADQPKPLFGKADNSVVRLGKGVFGKKVVGWKPKYESPEEIRDVRNRKANERHLRRVASRAAALADYARSAGLSSANA